MVDRSCTGSSSEAIARLSMPCTGWLSLRSAIRGRQGKARSRSIDVGYFPSHGLLNGDFEKEHLARDILRWVCYTAPA